MNKYIRIILLLSISFSFLGCTMTEMNARLLGNEPQVKEPYQSSDLQYLDSDQFDNALSIAMNKEHREIEVAAISAFSSNNIPNRLDAWLTIIGEKGGDVKLEPAEGERSIVGLALILYSIYKELQRQNRYVPAKNYDATLIYRRNSNDEAMVEKIIFSRKQK